MNTFKRKSLHAAVLAGLGAVGMAGTANAVHVNPDHLGSVLIYPYFTVRADGGGTSTAYYDNYISIVNTTASTKAVKVRVLEGKRSAEVLDFNLFLSPFDVWTGAIVRTTTASDGEEGGKMISVDRSCVVPNALFSTATSNTLNRFKNFVYASAPADGGGTTLDRAREGYLEIFEMGDVTNATAIAAAKHNSAGVPANCGYFETNDSTLVTALAAPTGGLMGAASLINVRSGSDFSYDAVALANWQTGTPNYSRAGDVLPRLTGGNVVTSTIFTAAGNVVASTWANSRDAVSAAIMQQSVFNEWMLETNTASGTDWVVTFPTKFAYTGPVGTGAAIAPFNANFNNGSSCDIFTMNFYNREELTTTTPIVVLPSPEPSVVVTNNTFCYEANVLTFANSNMLGSQNLYNIDTTSIGRTGWAAINFTQAVQVLTPAASTVSGPNPSAVAQAHRGLPVVGFMIQDFSNGSVGTPPVLSNYGGLFVHKYFRSIGTTP
jgi:hypothetical protein